MFVIEQHRLTLALTDPFDLSLFSQGEFQQQSKRCLSYGVLVLALATRPLQSRST